jgi:hypothetical protein
MAVDVPQVVDAQSLSCMLPKIVSGTCAMLKSSAGR